MKTVQTLIHQLKNKDFLSENNKKKVGDLIEKASNSYYNTGKELMSDADFDELTREFKRLGGEIKVGALPPKDKGTINVKHSFKELVGTLDKTNFIFEKNVDDETKKSVEAWVNWLMKKLPKGHTFSLGISFKFDGNSIVIEYDKGNVKVGLTRGRNGLGMDLTHVFKDHKIKSKDNVGIKYEVIIPWGKYEELKKDTGISYANPRSMVSGKLGDDNAYDYYKYMELVPLWVKPVDGFMEREEQLEFIEENFGEENSLFKDYRLIEDLSEGNLDIFFEELEDMYSTYTTERSNLPFMIDGLVIEVIDQETRDILGYADDEPNWATALKFPHMEKVSTVTGFDFTLGDSGIITSRVWFEPVEFNGTIHNKQSLQNYRRFKELGLGIGSKVLVSYRNDTLTYITRVSDDEEIEAFSYTNECPVCKGEVKVTDTGAFAYCSNEACSGKTLGKIQNFLVKMDIKGIKESTIKKLTEFGEVTSIIDMYNLDSNKISKIPTLGATTAMNIIGGMSSKVPYDYEILGSLGIPSFSVTKAKDLSANYTIQELLDFDDDKLFENIIEIEGFSDKIASYIIKGIKNDRETIEFLIGREYKVYKEEAEKFANTEKLKIVFTNFRDEGLKVKLELMGHKVTSSVSRKTDIVVTPDPNSGTVKLKKAKEYGARIMTVDDFKKEVGL